MPPTMALGTMYFGTKLDEPVARDVLDAYVEAGGQWIDTANCYSFWASFDGSHGQSEAVIGSWLADRPGTRENVLLSTKAGATPVSRDLVPAPIEGLSLGVVSREIEASLRRLGADAVDLYWGHAEDRTVATPELVATFSGLVEEGKARRIGLSNHPAWRVAQARTLATLAGKVPFTAVQLRDSYLHPRPDAEVAGQDHRYGMMTPETLDMVDMERDLEAWAYTPLLSGAIDRDDRPLAEAYDHPGTASRMAALGRWSRELGHTRGQLVLAWLVARGIRPIVGVSSVAQLEQAMAATSTPLPAEALGDLDAA